LFTLPHMAVIFDGKKLAAQKEEILKAKVAMLNFFPKLTAVSLGDDPASQIYLRLKGHSAGRIGIDFEKKEFTEGVDYQEIIREIQKANQDEKVWGIMVQLPLPRKLEIGNWKLEILGAIAPSKDVDCLTKENLDLLKAGKPHFLPATVRGIMEILKFGKIKLRGKKIVVVGAKGFVGRPLVDYLRSLGSDVVGVDKETPDLGTKTKEADILISATGVPNLIKKEMVKKGVVVVDVGSPRGDVDFEKVEEIASFITPVPGGVGPMTVICLFENLLRT